MVLVEHRPLGGGPQNIYGTTNCGGKRLGTTAINNKHLPTTASIVSPTPNDPDPFTPVTDYKNLQKLSWTLYVLTGAAKV